ncbi:nitrite/sulfite reductase [Pseudogulbenkiania subflava]|uniref:Sulfite reductase (NADPH) hemoprotein beta-component n=1 Tax=Pseudogulbenkiania subflava DSM 22618 TaxID=1123014 RepID=A0A1Y6BDY7_9NEIS|nr:nitrite/sulfite reductase [Pseudogulbenkiania subflava]SME98589.1 sulfite reductase (NADPH) hemoprotein beta-component [Pseudogulbenkiania subflava DSM 22618]
MYRYDEVDYRIVRERVAQFRDQTRRFLAGELSEDEFRPLRLMNGLYIQRHAPMFRIAIPYGHLASRQLRKLAHIARTYDKGYGHFTTRQNMQFNWPALERVPDILSELADVEMHSIQTSGNCVRNTTTDAFAGVAADELIDPRPYCEIIRQWSTLHPEFAFLPRKFKIAVSGSVEDRAATLVHDVGLHVVRAADGEIGFKVIVGGGLGRTPIVGEVIREFLPTRHILTYLDAILRVYNRYGRRDNKFKARIKILVKALTPQGFAAKVEDEWLHLKDGAATLRDEDVAHYASFFGAPAYETLPPNPEAFTARLAEERAFARWVEQNTRTHRQPGYRSVVLSLKKTGVPPGDITAEQMEAVADWSERFGFGEVRVAHEQNVILPDIKESDLYEVWQLARSQGFATPNIGLLTDIICCPGGDFCSLANARSIPVAEAIQRKFDDLDYLHDLGEIDCNFSGCMNACGHHHIGNIGILGVDKNGEEWYQITLGGSQGNHTAIGKVIGPSFAQADVPLAFEKIMSLYVEQRLDGERFIETVRRIGLEPFKERVYAKHH